MSRPFRFAGAIIVALTLAAIAGKAVIETRAAAVTHVVGFARGAAIDDEGRATTAAVAAAMKADPALTAIVTGHTGTRGDAAANLDLAQARADAVAVALKGAGIAPERIETLAVGAAAPLPREDGESDRAWQHRLGRAEIVVSSRLPL